MAMCVQCGEKRGYKKIDDELFCKECYDEYMREINDTSDMHPNETFEEFMEHEDF